MIHLALLREIDQEKTPNFKVSKLVTNFDHAKSFSSDGFITLWRHGTGISQKRIFALFFKFLLFQTKIKKWRQDVITHLAFYLLRIATYWYIVVQKTKLHRIRNLTILNNRPWRNILR